MATPPTQRMGELHEIHSAEIFGGHKTKSSGNQWNDQTDGYIEHDDPFAFRWDGKSTKGQSITITVPMIEKIIEQSQGDRPAIPLRWYGNEKLTVILHDWVAVKDVDLSELLEAARRCKDLEIELAGARIAIDAVASERAVLHDVIKVTEGERDRARAALGSVKNELATSVLAGEAEPRQVPEYIPMLPWTIIHQVKLPNRVVNSGIHYDQDGHQSQFPATTVWVERAPNSSNRPRLMVNAVRVPGGDLYVDGKLHTRVAIDKPDIEVG